jgi:hypothetical protein
MKSYFYKVIVLIGLGLACSCSNYQPKYSRKSAGWENLDPGRQLTLKHTMYLLGDAGNQTTENPSPVLAYLRSKLISESENTSVIFLGDNIYDRGMPPKEDSLTRSDAEYRLMAQLRITDQFQGRPIFIPGNHDWAGWGKNGLERQEMLVENYLNAKKGTTAKDGNNYFLPDNGCSGPEAIELNDNIVVIVVDSQWWLADWDQDYKINDGCGVKNRETFKFAFENMVRKYKTKQLVIALHHPPYTYGPHGGASTWRQHIFPLTDLDPNLYIPLPVLGSIGVLIRGSIGSRQDAANKHYKDLRQGLLAGVVKNGSFIFVSGHEHAQQYIERSGQQFIVSGSASKTSPVRLGRGSEFASGKLGYSTLEFYEGGETWAKFWEVDPNGTHAHIVFQHKVKSGSSAPIDIPAAVFSEYELHQDSVMRPITANPVKPSGSFHNFMLGTHYRKLYLEKYPFPVLELEKFHGGVTPLKQGGGNQTNSLRVRDSTGREYVFRSMTKDVSRLLPFPFNKMTAAKYLAEDNFLSTHPFAPLAMPALANAIQIYHTNPALYYIPAQPGLGVFNPAFSEGLALVEERPDGKKWREYADFGHPDEIIGTAELIGNLTKNPKHKVDQAWTLRTRLLDFLVGDWDRHDDQWVWADIRQADGVHLYRPIPRDRDQAFSKYDGLMTRLAGFTMPFLHQLQVYGPEIRSYKWNTWSARLFDRTFLNELDWNQWEVQVRSVQARLTDKAIETAFTSWPRQAYALSAPHLIESIKSRRDNLMEIAREHYEFLASYVNIVGTDEAERLEVQRLDDHRTRIAVFQLDKDEHIGKCTFNRIFDRTRTSQINLYGNGGGDQFVVTGQVHKGIRIRLVGGTGKDTFIDSSAVSRGLRKTIVYDDLHNNNVVGGRETKDRRTSLYRFNVFDRRGSDSEYNITLPVPVLGVNPDDGLLAGANFTMTRYGFKKEPYASLQRFGGSYAFGTKAVKVHYTADFIHAFRPFDLYVDTYYHGPTYAFNYAGIGNETVREVADPNYYRVRQTGLHLYPAIKKRFPANTGSIALGPVFELFDTEKTQDRYIASDAAGLPQSVFETKYYGGAKLLFDFANVDNFSAPHAGIRLHTDLNWLANLKEDKNYGSLNAGLAFYKSLDKQENLVIASQVGTGVNIGNAYEFFQMPTIGGQQGLRGYRTQRFYGKSALWHNTDLRVRFGSSYNKALPFTFGVFGSFDYGRVWVKNDHSGQWHYNYGGGVYFAPIDILILSIGGFIPKEAQEESPRITFRLGFDF